MSLHHHFLDVNDANDAYDARDHRYGLDYYHYPSVPDYLDDEDAVESLSRSPHPAYTPLGFEAQHPPHWNLAHRPHPPPYEYQPAEVRRPTSPQGCDDAHANHVIKLKPVSLLPDMYRTFFKFGVFNAVQSRCYDAIMHSSDNLIISAPTGSGKTVLFELALIRLLTAKDPTHVKCVYMAPTKALCSERFRDWTAKFDPIGIKSCELTGDTVGYGKNALAEAKSSSVLITTPEKFDSLTRNWRDHGEMLSQTHLFLIDEVHILNETRGSTLEVVVSRMKTRGKQVRFLLISATVPNIEDVAEWIGNGPVGGPAGVYKFGDEFRPCKLTRIVYGYPRKNQNEFSFSRMLDYKLLGLLQSHASNKPVLIFCATRKGVVGSAEVLAKAYKKLMVERQSVPWTKPRQIDGHFHDKQLQEFAEVGIGVHHAGLTLEDRRFTEDLFLKKIIRVVVATSTLAVGVNLPAHTVVIKGVKMWQSGEWQEYSDLDFIQMIGRAGRPQFDQEGVALILCDTDQERKYKALISGQTLLESCLHQNLAEHLNSEVGLGTITDLTSAKDWLHNSFLFQRIQKNPRHYALNKGTDQTWQSKIDELVESSMGDLQEYGLVSATDKYGERVFSSTELGEIMSKYYVRLHTMKTILRMSDQATLRDILEVISSAEELGNLRLRAGEKQMYKKLSELNEIRFHTKLEKASDKIFLIIQAVLGGISFNSPEYKLADSQPFLEALSVFRHAPRIARTIVEVAIVRKSGRTLKHGMELVRSLTAKAWEDRPVVLRQIEQIGEKSIKVLAQNGVTTLMALRGLKPSQIEVLLNRRPPFGDAVLAAVQELPQYTLSIKEVSLRSSKGQKPVMVELRIEAGLVLSEPPLKSTSKKQRKSGLVGMTAILTLTSDDGFVDFRRIPTKWLKDTKSFVVKISLDKPSQTVVTHISPDNFAGLTVTETYKPSIPPSEFPTLDTRPVTFDVDDILAGLEEDPNFWEINTDDIEGNGGQPHRHSEKQCQSAVDKQVIKVPKKNDRSETPASTTKKGSKQALTNAFSRLNEKDRANANLRDTESKDPVKLSNGNYACNHTCKRKNQCRHICCREGLPNPPKRPQATSSSKKSAPSRGDKCLTQLESLHNSSHSLISAGCQLKLGPAKSPFKTYSIKESFASTLAPEKDEMIDGNEELPNAHDIIRLEIQGKARKRTISDSGNSSSGSDVSFKNNHFKLSLKEKQAQTPTKTLGPRSRLIDVPMKAFDQKTYDNRRASTKKRKIERSPVVVLSSAPAVEKPAPAQPYDIKPTKRRLFLSDEDDLVEDVCVGEEFTLDLSLFDMEPTPNAAVGTMDDFELDMSGSHLSMSEQYDREDTQLASTIYGTSCITNATDKNREEAQKELDDYEQGLAELEAWFCSGAVEIIDEIEE